MPRYDYRCVECAHEFELVQSFSEAGTATCPQCSSAGRRLYHAVPVIYKGSGFYTTDYGRPKPPADNGKWYSGVAAENPFWPAESIFTSDFISVWKLAPVYGTRPIQAVTPLP